MALKKPLVIASGQVEQLQSGDYINAEEIPQYANGEASPIVIGMPVYVSGVDTVKKAKADAAGTSVVVGMVYDTSITNAQSGGILLAGVLAATTGQWDTVAGTSGGLTAGTIYYLDPTTAGNITATAPTVTGKYVVQLGIAISTTELKLNIQQSVLL